MIDIGFRIFVVIILLACSAFCSSSETAMTTISPHRVRTLVDEGVKRAATLEKVISQKGKMLSVILICNNIVNLSASTITTVIFQDLFGSSAVGIGTGVLTALVLIFGEITPKTMATYRAEKIALRFCGIVHWMMIICTPIAIALNFISMVILRICGVKKDEKPDTITEGELRTIVQVSHEEGVIESEEKDIIYNIFDFSDTSVHEIMVPRIKVTAININSTYDEIMKIFEENYFTRYPVYSEDGNEIIGMVNIKDLVILAATKKDDFHVKDILRDIGYTFEQKRLGELFIEMKKNYASMMVVLDEYGDTAGIVTMEDLLEEIVGDIRDEYDEDEEQEIVRIGKNVYLIQGQVSLDDINDKLGTSFESEDYDSIGGLLMGRLDRLPKEGDKINEDDAIIVAYKTDNTHTELVKLILKEPENEQ